MRIVWKSTLCLILAVMAFLGPSPKQVAFAQDSCVPIIDQLRLAIASCARLNSNSACYGNGPAFASPLEIDFDAPGEQQPVTALQTIETSPDAGAVLMMLHLIGAESPVKVILFGGTELQGGAGNIFTLGGEPGGELCPQTPSGMVIRTESGRRGVLTVNGVQIELGSTAYIVMSDTGTMIIANLEGQVAVSVGGQRQVIPVGYQSLVVQVGSGQPVFQGLPTPSALFGSAVGQFLANGADGLRLVTEVTDESTPTAACGSRIVFGQTVTAQIATPGAECLFTFCSLEGRAATINLERVGSTGDPWVALRRPDGTLLRFNDDINEQNTNSRICNPALPQVGCYTIVTRFDDNSTGSFRLSLSEQSACAVPAPRCAVVGLALNQREGPGLNFPIIRTLPQGTQLRPFEGSADRQWVRAAVAGTSQEGWVSTSTQLLACEDAIPGPLVIEPTATPTPVVPDDDDEPVTPGPKEGPIGGP